MAKPLPDDGISCDDVELPSLNKFGNPAAVGPYPQGTAYQEYAREHEELVNKIKDAHERAREQGSKH